MFGVFPFIILIESLTVLYSFICISLAALLCHFFFLISVLIAVNVTIAYTVYLWCHFCSGLAWCSHSALSIIFPCGMKMYIENSANYRLELLLTFCLATIKISLKMLSWWILSGVILSQNSWCKSGVLLFFSNYIR